MGPGAELPRGVPDHAVEGVMAGLQHRLVYELHGLAVSGALVTVQRWDGRPGQATVIVAVNPA